MTFAEFYHQFGLNEYPFNTFTTEDEKENQSPLCSDVFLFLWDKKCHPHAPLLLLSKPNLLPLGFDLVLPLRGIFRF